MKRITQTKEIQSGDNSGIVISGNEKVSYSRDFELIDFSNNELITLKAANELINSFVPTGSTLNPWAPSLVTDLDNYVTHPINGVEYLFRSNVDDNLSEPTLSTGVGPAWTDLAHNGFPVFWDEVTTYSLGEWVAINDGGIYYTYTSKIAGNLNNLPPSGESDTNWLYKGITKGYFPDDAPYSLNDIVLDGSDNLYISNVDNNTYALDEDAPLNSDWQVIGYVPGEPLTFNQSNLTGSDGNYILSFNLPTGKSIVSIEVEQGTVTRRIDVSLTITDTSNNPNTLVGGFDNNSAQTITIQLQNKN